MEFKWPDGNKNKHNAYSPCFGFFNGWAIKIGIPPSLFSFASHFQPNKLDHTTHSIHCTFLLWPFTRTTWLVSTRTSSVAVHHWAVQTPWKPQWVNVRKLIGTNNIYTAFRFLSDKRLKIIKIYRLNIRQSLCTNKKLFFLIYVYVHSSNVRISHTPIPQD